VVRPVHVGARDTAQDGVDQPADPTARERDGLAHRGMRRYVGAGDLVRAEAQQRPDTRVHRTYEEAVDEVIAGAAHACRAVHELGDEASISLVEVGTFELGAQGEVRVRALVVDAAQRPQRDGPRVHVPKRSSAVQWTPLAHALAAMRALPSGWTSSTSSGVVPVAMVRPSPVGFVAVRQMRMRAPRNVVHAPPRRTTRCSSSAGRDQSSSSSAGSILDAYTASPT